MVDEKFVRQGHAKEVLRLGRPDRPPLRPGLVAPQLDVHDLPEQPELGPNKLQTGALAAIRVSAWCPSLAAAVLGNALTSVPPEIGALTVLKKL